MTIFQTYINAITLLVPVFSAAACVILTGFSRRDCLTPEERTLKSIIILYLSMTALGWFATFCYVFFPKVFVYLNVPCLIGYILTPIFFYRIIRFLMLPGRPEQFSPAHYLAPGLIVVLLFIWSLFVPFDVQLEIVKSKMLAIPGEYEIYSRFFTSKPLLRVVFITVYYFLICLLLVRYYRRANDPDSSVHKPAKWVIFLIVVSLALMLTSMSLLLLPRNKVFVLAWAVAAFGIVAQHVLLTYHIIRRRYLSYVVHTDKEETDVRKKDDRGNKIHVGKLTEQRLENWFHDQKPYLKSDFKITDIVEAMDVNRTVVSSFINKNYGVNFNCYVNRWRLKEFERLKALPSNKGKSASKLFIKAGFSDLRQYYRTVAAERK